MGSKYIHGQIFIVSAFDSISHLLLKSRINLRYSGFHIEQKHSITVKRMQSTNKSQNDNDFAILFWKKKNEMFDSRTVIAFVLSIVVIVPKQLSTFD